MEWTENDVQISIAMATYNGEKYLQEQLDSLANQALMPAELVVGDDGSSDRTMEILERFATSAPFEVQITRNERNLGHAENFLRTARRCRADWIAFCDQDDVWHPAKLDRFAKTVQADPCVTWMVCRNRHVDDRLRRLWSVPFPAGRGVDRTPLTSPVRLHDGHRMIFQRWFVDLPFETRPISTDGRPISHDRWLSALSALFGCRAFVPDRLTLYRQHPQSVTSQNRASLRDGASEMGPRHMFYAERDRFWRAMASWCRCLSTTVTPIAVQKRLIAADECETIAALYRRRAAIHARDRSPLGKIALVSELIRVGAYRSVFGQPPMLRDVLALLRNIAGAPLP